MKKILIKLFRAVLFFTEDMVYIVYSEGKLKRIAERAESYYEDETNPDWRRAYMKARYDIVKRRVDEPKAL